MVKKGGRRDRVAFSITNLTKGKTARLPFDSMKEGVLGSSFEVSLVLAGAVYMQNLNRHFRNKNHPANVLAFPLSVKSGEIFIEVPRAKKEIGKLFIHGLLHLKGMRHGVKMEHEELKFFKKFKLN